MGKHRQRQRKGEMNLSDLLIVKHQIYSKSFAKGKWNRGGDIELKR